MNPMNTRTILASSAALLSSILDPAPAQELPKPPVGGPPGAGNIPRAGAPPAAPSIPRLPGRARPGKPPVGGPPGADNAPGAGLAPPAPRSIPGLDPIPEGAPVTEPKPKPVSNTIPGLEPIPGAIPVEPIRQEPSARTGREIIREAKLKVLRKHYEETLSETIQ